MADSDHPGEPTTLSALFDRIVAARPDAVAVIDGQQSTDWADLSRRVAGLGAQLTQLGVARGGRVALWLPNGRDYLVAILAVARLGALAIHVNTRLGPAEVGDLIVRTCARVLITHPSLRAKRRGVLPRHLHVIGDEEPLRVDGSCPDRATSDTDCLVYTTGGTTARPKLVVHRHHSIAAHALTVAPVAGFDQPDAAYLAAVPLCGTFGNIGAMAALAGGATLVMMPTFDADEAARLIDRHRITHLLGDDRLIDRLAAAGTYESIRFCGAAAFGADARPALARGVASGLKPRAIYGSSEVQALFALGDPAAGGWGAVVPVDPAARVAVIEDELRLAGPSLFDRYLDDDAATGAAREDGLFRTSDRGTVEGDGFVFDGRMGDVLRLGGFLVSPLEIEAFLTRQPGVAEAQVVGVEGAQNGGRGTAPFAFVIAHAGAGIDEAALIAACTADLARYKVPVRIVAIEAFPTSTGPNGPKISRADLRRLAADTPPQQESVI